VAPPNEAPAAIGAGGLNMEQLAEIVDEAGSGRLDPKSVAVSEVDYAFGTPATAGLRRFHGTDADGCPWSLFCKIIQHPRHSTFLTRLPAEAAANLISHYPWRQELDLWDPEFRATMPAGIRPPRLYRVVEMGDDRLALWMEDVPCVSTPWDLPRYATAARVLGRWNQRARDADLLASTGRPPHFPLRVFAQNALRARGLAPLADDELWNHPWLRTHAELRHALQALAPRLVELVDRLDAMPLCRPHGDACPQNLLVPADEPGTFFIPIDVSQQAPTALGCELGQLAVGLIHADVMPPAALPGIIRTILPAYITGLRQEGYVDEREHFERAMWTSLLIRSGFDSLRYDLLSSEATDVKASAFASRVELTYHIVSGAAGSLMQAE